MGNYLQTNRRNKLFLLTLLMGMAGMINIHAQSAPEGTIIGTFSVSKTEKIWFSKGNLQYKASTNTWRFADKQYDYIGSANSNASSTYSGYIDLFGWGTSGYNHGATCYQPWSTSTGYNDYNVYGGNSYSLYDQTGQADWGYNAISNGGNQENYGWRTLTKNEWEYLFFTRSTSSGIRYAKAQVNGIKGVILLPDDWLATYYSLNNTNNYGSSVSYTTNTITATQWSTLEQHGAVFLPNAGDRYGTSVENAGTYGYYWTASYQNSQYAYKARFEEGLSVCVAYYRFHGYSVRLVQAAPHNISATANPSGSGSVSGAGFYKAGTECTLTATASSGYQFVNWTENDEVVSTDAEYTFTVNGDRTLVANFSLIPYTISATENPAESGTCSVEEGNTIDFEEASIPSAWDNSSSSYPWTIWSSSPHGGSYCMASSNYHVSSSTSFIEATVEYVEDGSIDFYSRISSQSNNDYGHFYIDGTKMLYESGTSNTWTARHYEVTAGTHTFRWDYYKNGSTNSGQDRYFIDDICFTGCISNPNTTVFHYGEICKVSAVASTGYEFANWTENGVTVSTNTEYVFTVTEDRTLVANFSPIPYAISATTNPTNSGSCSVEKYYDFENATIPGKWNNSSSSYPWTIWSSNPHSGSYCMASNNYHNSYTSSYVEATVVFVEDGSVDFFSRISSQSYDYGRFYIDGTEMLNESGTSNTWTARHYEVTSGTHTFRWYYFKGASGYNGEDRYYIDDISFTGSQPGVSGVEFYYGDPCRVLATTNSGYRFVSWTDNGDVVSVDPAYTFVVTGDRSLVANYELVPTGAIEGRFSVGSDKTVWFSQGNLQYQASSKTWRFATNQWDFVGGYEYWNYDGNQYEFVGNVSGSSNNSISSSYSGWIDLFSWGTSGYSHGAASYQPWSHGDDDDEEDYYAYGNSSYNLYDQTGKADWGYNKISNGGNIENYWRTLTSEEWDYLLNTRAPSSGIRYAKATVNDVKGLILLPDDWDTSYYTFNSPNTPTAVFLSNTITASDWTGIVSHGAVFLPVTGCRIEYRYESKLNIIEVTNLGVTYTGRWSGCYWSSSVSGGDPKRLSFGVGSYYHESFLGIGSGCRSYGNAVRLVRNTSSQYRQIRATSNPSNGGSTQGEGIYVLNSSCSLTATPSNGYYFVNWTKNGEVVSTNPTFTFTVTESAEYVANFADIPGNLNGIFTINSDGDQVNFSQGNLQYQASSDTWRFAESQWDCLGDSNSNISPTNEGWIDLFGWGTSGWNSGANCYQPWSTSTKYNDYYPGGSYPNNLTGTYANADWGVYNAITNGGNRAALWRTLTSGEWDYLLETRTTPSGKRYAMAQVNGINGVVLLPDNWSEGNFSLNNTNNSYASFNSNVISASDWINTLEAYGAVFLPVTGYRDGTSVSSSDSYGYYWSASYGNYYDALCVHFYNSTIYTTNRQRNYGSSVRLVCPSSDDFISINAPSNPAIGGVVSGGGTYLPGSACTLTATANEDWVFVNWTENGEVVSSNTTYSFTVTSNKTVLANFSFTKNAPVGAINGLFSISENDPPVYFSQGNLQYTGSTWKFAEQQWDCLGTTTNQNSTNSGVSRDLFGWGTSGYDHGAVCYQPWSTSTNNSDYYAYGNYSYNLYDRTGTADWGINAISNADNTLYHSWWRTPTKEEWEYLFYNRITASGIRYANAQVNGINGVILLPDNWSPSYYNLSNTNESAPFESNVITATQWISLEQHGAVFLPAAGSRYGTNVYSVGDYGCYWSSSYYNQNESVYVYIDAYNGAAPNHHGSRYSGLSVRMVHAFCTYSINASSKPSAGGTVSGGGNYTKGSNCTITATASENYHFVNWTENGSVVSTDPEYSFIVMGNRTLIANFSLNSFVVTTTANPAQGGTCSFGSYTCGFENANIPSEWDNSASSYPWTIWNSNSHDGSYCMASGNFNVASSQSYIEATMEFFEDGAVDFYSRISSQSSYDYGRFYIDGTQKLSESGTSNTWTARHYNVTAGTHTFRWFYYKNGSTNSGEDRYFIDDITFTGCYSESSSIVFHYGENCKVIATANTNYNFQNWTENGSIVSTDAEYSFTVTGNKNLVANFIQNSFEITATANPSAGGTVSGAGTYNSGANCTLTATATTGYTFLNWTENGTTVSTNATYSFTVENARTLVANFSPNTYTVTLNANGGTINSGNVTSYTYGVGATLPTNVTRTGYTFGGWYANSSLTGSPVTSIPTTATGNKTYWAKWIVNTYTVTLNTNGGSINGGNVTSYTYGVGATLPTDVTRPGYTFGGWYENSNLTGSAVTTISTTATGNKTFWAKWTINSYAITASANPSNGGTVTGAGTCDHFSTCTLTATAATGYTFVNWTENGTEVSTNAAYSFTVTGPRTLVANFSLNSYSITVAADPTAGGTVTGAGTYNHGENVTLTAHANTGYTFVNWTKDGATVSTDATYSFTVTEPGAYAAHFSLNSYEVMTAADPEEGGTVTGAGTYNYGESCTITATANEGYTFDHWSDGYASEYFTIESLEDDNTITLTIGSAVTSAQLTYVAWSKDKTNWNVTTVDDTEQVISVPANAHEKVYWKGEGTNYARGYSNNTEWSIFSATGLHKVYGNIASLLFGDDFEEVTALPSSPNNGRNFQRLFAGDANLTDASNLLLPFTTIQNNCLAHMFYGCTSLTQAPRILPAMTAREYCYSGMFDGCSSLTIAPEMPATTLAYSCYSTMFNGCISLTSPPTLPATTMVGLCYLSMFNGCTSLSVAPALPSTALATSCYNKMFQGCTSFTMAPELPATELASSCYQSMFEGCSVLVSAPVLPATTLQSNCYRRMFANCTSLNELTCLATDISATDCLYRWLIGVSSTGTFFKNAGMNDWPIGIDGIPSGWTTEDADETDYAAEYFTIESLEDNNTITLTIGSAVTSVQLTYVAWSKDKVNWTSMTIDDTEQVISVSANAHEKVYWKGSGNRMAGSSDVNTGASVFTATNQHKVYGNIMSLLYTDNFADKTSFPGNNNARQFQFLFYNNATLTDAKDLVLPVTTLKSWCYDSMFSGCTSLVNAPKLPATTLGQCCYEKLFYGCASLTTAPALPATTLTKLCYNSMFNGCSSLIVAPELPATTMAESCYLNMFRSCASLNQAPELPATTMAPSCYAGMFYNCTSLTLAPTLPATTLEQSCYADLFRNCTLLNNIICLATDVSATTCTSNWVNNVASIGTFHKAAGMNDWPTGVSGIPSGWTVFDATPVNPTETSFTYTVTDDHYWLAHFTLNNYEINASANPSEGGTVTGAGNYDHFATCTLTATANTGYTFQNWTLNNNAVSTDAEYSFQVSGGGDYVANFTLNSYAIDASANPTAGGSVSGAGTYNHGATATLTATAATGYTFVNWTENGTAVSTDATYSFMVENPRTLVANFSLNSYTITATANPTEGGSITGAGTCDHFSTCTLTATAATGYTFVNWTENGTAVSTDATYSFAVAGPRTLVANFSLNSYSITVAADPTAGGTVTGAGTYNHGENVTLTAHANTGYTFVNWTKDGAPVSTDATYSFTVTEPGTYAAHFSLNSYEVMTAADPEAGGTVTGAGTYNYGESCTITATANEGYTFDHWSDGYASEYFTIESLEDNNTITLTIGSAVTSANLTYVAWSKDKTNWNVTTVDDTEQVISVPANAHEKVYWKGEGNAYACGPTDATQWSAFSSAKTINVSGNISSLLFGDNFIGQTTMPAWRNFADLFCGCDKLLNAQNLIMPAMTLTSTCYKEMFKGCTSLLTAPRLPATTLANICYEAMFQDCSSLTTAPALPATTATIECYYGMFRGCTSLEEAPELPATILANSCYQYMFYDCSSLTTTPKLPATTLDKNCYRQMFRNCTSLVAAPELSATVLKDYCYAGLFNGCTKLATAPVLPATTLVSNCYNQMFRDCSLINEITCLAVDISATNCTQNWLSNVSAIGNFHKAAGMNDWPTGASGIPSGWTTEDADETDYTSEYFTIESLEDNNTITLTIPAAITTYYMTSVSYSIDNGTTWNTTEIDGTAKTISVTLPNSGNKVSFKGIGRTMSIGNSHDENQSYFSGSKYYVVHGNIASLLYGDDFADKTIMPASSFRTYQGLFMHSTTLTSAQHLVMPFDSVAGHCFRDMFEGCTALTQAPALPAVTLNSDCYMYMFGYCTALTQAPELPATTLASECYNQMFIGCSALTHAPVLSNTALKYMCYYRMFEGCTALTQAPDLPATTLASKCCYRMFAGCTSLTKAPDLSATVLMDYCYKEMFAGCTSLNEVTCLATDLSATECTLNWLNNVPSTGTFHKAAGMNDWPTGASGIPSGWTVFDATPVNPTEPSFTYTVTDDQYWLAHFTLNNYEINASANPTEGGTVAGAGTYDHFDTCTLVATANTGYHFTNWTEDGAEVSTAEEYSFEVTGARTLVANFTLNSYEITATADPAEGGTITGAGTYNHGETVNLSATVNKGYVFDGWSRDGETVSTELGISFTATEAADYVAHFTHLSYPVQAVAFPTEGGTVAGAGTYYHGDLCTLTATATAGYVFIYWTKDGSMVSSSPSLSFEVTGPATYVANFMSFQFNVSATVTPEGAGTVTGTGTYSLGATCTLTATANEGYAFVNWTLNGTVVGTEPQYSFAVSGAVTLVANFERTTVTQQVTLSTGWNWFSSYIDPGDPVELLDMLKEALGDNALEIQSYDDNTEYFDGEWFGGLDDTGITNDQMYMILVANDCTIELEGPVADPANYPITINKGWNWIGFPCNQEVDIVVAFGDFDAEEGDVIQTVDDQTEFDGEDWFGDVETMVPGRGVMYFSNSDEPKVLVIQTGNGKAAHTSGTASTHAYTPHFKVVSEGCEGLNTSITGVVTIDLVEQKNGALEIGVFDQDGICRAAKLPKYRSKTDQWIYQLVIKGAEGFEYTFRVFDHESGTELDLVPDMEKVVYDTQAPFGSLDDPYRFAFLSTTGVDENVGVVNLYPNPADKEERVRVELPSFMETIGARVEVYDALGKLITTGTVNGSDVELEGMKVSGLYTVKVTDRKGRICYSKLVVK